MTDGYLHWDTRLLTTRPTLAGHVLSDSIPAYAVASAPAGVSLPLLGGGAVHQHTPAFAHLALDQGGELFALTLDGDSEGDYFHLQRMKALAQVEPLPFVVEDPREDVWVIPAAPRTAWALSRPMAPRAPLGAWLVDRPSGVGEEAALQLVEGAPPGADQLAWDPATPDTVETEDLSAHVGRLLVFRYYPVRYVVIESLERGADEPNALVWDLTLREVLPR